MRSPALETAERWIGRAPITHLCRPRKCWNSSPRVGAEQAGAAAYLPAASRQAWSWRWRWRGLLTGNAASPCKNGKLPISSAK